MPILELPHTRGCLVCGRNNPHGLMLTLHVEPATGVVSTVFTPGPEHIGFEGIVHGGVVATVLDEAMVWAATWRGRRFCVCGEMTVRFRRSAVPGEPVTVTAKVESDRPRLLTASGEVTTVGGAVVATASGKYVPIDDTRNEAFVATLVDQPSSRTALEMLRNE